MTVTDEVLQILREHDFPISRKEIFTLAKGAENADEVSRSLNYLNKRGLINKITNDLNEPATWSIADPALRKPEEPIEKPIGERLKEALRTGHVPPKPIPPPRPLDPPPGPKHTPAPKPILPPSAKPLPIGKLGYSIHDGGALTIYFNDGMSEPLDLDADETLALGDFLHATQGLWRL